MRNVQKPVMNIKSKSQVMKKKWTLGLRGLVTLVAISFVSACTYDPLVAGDLSMTDISLFEQPLGESRENLSKSFESIWQSEAACELQKTGYGLTRRAYFLETCGYSNQSGATVCSRAIELVRYRYFEDSLVQVIFEFDGQPSEEYKLCIIAAASENHFNEVSGTEGWMNQDHSISIRLGDSDETIVSAAAEVAKIHRLRGQ